ncbi:hypothetical protein GH714_032889 [Hevea brasiliensis]|uniref:Uncharacterized protein n=1 Tax=Hevea brasiliensis TaxID=3981 RepID=A0A6A6LKZ6_HEVBR|nr:hypothetical protein GH714_032889 [Hevea brasiliensis]
MAAATLSVRPNRLYLDWPFSRPLFHLPNSTVTNTQIKSFKNEPWRATIVPSSRRPFAAGGARASSRADDSAPSEMSVENALKLSVETAYDMLLMRSLTQRRSGKVANSGIRYADVKPLNSPGLGSVPQWLQTTMKNAPISVETPSAGDLGIQAGVYGAMMVLTYVNGATTSSVASYAGADVPGLILATSFGASLYFMTKRNVKLGKATVITLGGLVAGAVVGSTLENWLQVDVVPFLGIHSPATVVSEFILFSQFLVSLYLR